LVVFQQSARERAAVAVADGMVDALSFTPFIVGHGASERLWT
jgi:hypothetical protein